MGTKLKTPAKRPFSQDFSGNSKTDQSFSAACDVNNIVRHYEATGIDPHIDRKALEQYGDASSIPYEESMRNVAEVQSAFASLSSLERRQHANDPQTWLEHLQALAADPEPLSDSATAPEPPPAEPPPEDSTNDKSGG